MSDSSAQDRLDQLDNDLRKFVGLSVLYLRETSPQDVRAALESGALSQELYAQMNRWSSSVDASIPPEITDAAARNAYVRNFLTQAAGQSEAPSLDELKQTGQEVGSAAETLSSESFTSENADRLRDIATLTSRLNLSGEEDAPLTIGSSPAALDAPEAMPNFPVAPTEQGAVPSFEKKPLAEAVSRAMSAKPMPLDGEFIPAQSDSHDPNASSLESPVIEGDYTRLSDSANAAVLDAAALQGMDPKTAAAVDAVRRGLNNGSTAGLPHLGNDADQKPASDFAGYSASFSEGVTMPEMAVDEAAAANFKNPYLAALEEEQDAEASAVRFTPEELAREDAENSVSEYGEPNKSLFDGLAQKYADMLPAHIQGLISEIRPYEHSVTIKLHDGSQLRDLRSEIKLDTDPTEDSVAVLLAVVKARGMKEVNINGDLKFKSLMYDALLAEGIDVKNWSPDHEALESAQRLAKERNQQGPENVSDLAPIFDNADDAAEYAGKIDPKKQQELSDQDTLAAFDAEQDDILRQKEKLTEEEIAAINETFDEQNDAFDELRDDAQDITQDLRVTLREQFDDPTSELRQSLSDADVETMSALLDRELDMADRAYSEQNEEIANDYMDQSAEAADMLRSMIKEKVSENGIVGAHLHELVNAEVKAQDEIIDQFDEIIEADESLDVLKARAQEATNTYHSSVNAFIDEISDQIEDKDSDLHKQLSENQVSNLKNLVADTLDTRFVLDEMSSTATLEERGRALAKDAMAIYELDKFTSAHLENSDLPGVQKVVSLYNDKRTSYTEMFDMNNEYAKASQEVDVPVAKDASFETLGKSVKETAATYNKSMDSFVNEVSQQVANPDSGIYQHLSEEKASEFKDIVEKTVAARSELSSVDGVSSMKAHGDRMTQDILASMELNRFVSQNLRNSDNPDVKKVLDLYRQKGRDFVVAQKTKDHYATAQQNETKAAMSGTGAQNERKASVPATTQQERKKPKFKPGQLRLA